MPETITALELSKHPVFEGEPPDTLEWIASLLEVSRFQAGDIVVQEGEPVEHLFIILEGELHFRMPGYHSLMVTAAGEATGLLPFSRMKVALVRGIAAQPVRLARLHGRHLRELVYRAPLAAQRLVSKMTERAREFTRMEESSNRLLALGKLAAGLAHELNNPASAAVRSSARLREVLTERRGHALALRTEVLPKPVADLMHELGLALSECHAATPGAMDPIDRADRESDMGDWLESVGAPNYLASGLVDAGFRIDQLSPLAPLVPTRVLGLGLQVLVADHEILCLTRELEETSTRIADLVQSVKSYSRMDQSATTEVDIEQGIEVTLRMFQYQLKHGIQVSKEFAGNLPKVRGMGSALNQVWTNLIDNALDAMNNAALEPNPPDRPKVLHVRTCLEPDGVLVEIGDNGAGIPKDLQRRIFEPFFTTKPVGEGTGLGLDIVQRIVRDHQGSLRVESEPGRTVMQVRLPLPAGPGAEERNHKRP